MRARAGLAVLALVVACSGKDTADVAAGTSTPGVAPPGGSVLTLPGGGTTALPPGSAPPGGGGPGPAGTATTTTASGGGSGAPTTAPPAAVLDGDGAPGSFAPAVLRPSPMGGSSVLVDLLAQPGAAPGAASVDHLTTVLAQVTGKAVSVAGPAAVSGGAQAWTESSISAAADRDGSAQGSDGRAVLHLLFVRGTFRGDDSILGITVRGDVAAIFTDQVEAASTPLIGSDGIEEAVVTHEMGHLLGLVDLFLSTGRADPEHPAHSRNRGSVMYWAVESSLVADLLTGGPPRDFDADDLADLATIRGGG